MPLRLSSSEPIASRAASEATERLRLENARHVSVVRIVGVTTALALFVGFGRVLDVQDYRGGDVVFLVELLLAVALYRAVRRSRRAAHASAYAHALLDVPAIGLVELTLLPNAPNPGELVAFNGATFLMVLLAAALHLAPGPILATALSASVCHGALQLHTGGHPSHLASTGVVFGLAGALCTYAALRMRGLVVSAATRGLELEGAARSLQQQAELLRASEKGFRSLLDLAPDGAFIVRAGRVSYANRPLARLLGYEPETLSALPLEALVGSSDLQHLTAPALQPSGASEPREVVLRTRTGELRHVELVGRPIESSEAAAWLFMTRDLSERRLLEARLIGADRLASMGLLAAGVAHEINTPLAVVVASLEYLEREFAARTFGDESELRDPLLDAREAASRAAEIVRDLRLFSRAEPAPFPVDVRDALESAVRMAMSELRQRAQLERRLVEVPRVRASESRLAQVFLNLLNNAGEAIPRGSPASHVVSLRTFTNDAGWPVVEIADTGSGIAPADLGEVFRPFFTTKGSTGGSGLGLAICDRLVHEIGGRIEVESELGRGSKFRVVLPPADRVALAVERAVSTAPAHARPLRILVIDDDPAICRAFSRLLGKGERTTTLESSREAIEHIESGERFDVIFCDVMMPNLPGAQLLALLDERWPDQAARVVFITGGVLGPGGRSFLEAHPGRLIEKPFTLAQIRAAIEGRLVEVGLESSAEEPGSSRGHALGPRPNLGRDDGYF